MKKRRADVAWLKSAYMVAFATWGYMYAFAPGLKIVQRQLEQCGEAIIPHFKLTRRANHAGFSTFIAPTNSKASPSGWEHIVLLPPDGRDMTFYERIAPLSSVFSPRYAIVVTNGLT